MAIVFIIIVINFKILAVFDQVRLHFNNLNLYLLKVKRLWLVETEISDIFLIKLTPYQFIRLKDSSLNSLERSSVFLILYIKQIS